MLVYKWILILFVGNYYFCEAFKKWGISEVFDRLKNKTKRSKEMKKMLKVLGMLVMGLVLLGACGGGGSSEETNTFTGTMVGTDAEVAVTHTDQDIKTVKIVSSFDLASLGYDVADLDETQQSAIEESLAAQFEQYDGTDGVTIENEFTDSVFSMTMTLDMEKIDATTLSSLTGTTAESEDISSLTYDDFVGQLEDLGFTEEK